MPPFDVREPLEKVCLEHPWGGDEQPVRVVYYLQVLLTTEGPNLREEGLVRVNDSLDILLEGADHHCICHFESKWMMKLHFLVNSLQMFLLEQNTASGVMNLE